MKNILEEIVAYKRTEVAARKEEVTAEALVSAPGFSRKCFSLAESLRDPARSGIITEFKRRSPSKGVINASATVEDVTTKYTRYGASGLSVLTDAHFFGGGSEDLGKARSFNRIPILRKDFVVDAYQVMEAKAMGADVILLIAECLTKQEVAKLASQARELHLEVLLEMHSEAQLDKLSPDVTLVGINNRDLTNFQVDIDRSISLAGKLPATLPKIAESGIDDPETVVRMRQAGFSGFLMGEHFMKHADPGEAFRRFVEKVSALSGAAQRM
jgi:indole-3-glycerol phosphate synthase